MKEKGFTLIELLAVIVILAIIALIAVPIVLNIINESIDSANQRSAELYEKAVLNSVLKEQMDGTTIIEEGTYIVDSNGSICKEEVCIKVEVDGQRPDEGSTIILGSSKENNNQVDRVIGANLVFGSKTVTKENGHYKIGEGTSKKEEYTISITGTNVKINGDATYSGTIEEGSSITLTLSPNDGYTLPSSITVENAEGTQNKAD